MQFTEPNKQLRLGSQLVDWHWDATSGPYGCYWMTCRRKQTFDFVNEQTVDVIPQLFIAPKRLQFKSFSWYCYPGKILITIYIKQNMFHLTNFGQDVELRNTNIVPFKSHREVKKVTTLRTS